MSVLSRAQAIFPPPQFMSFPCVGVDISDTSLKYIEFQRVRPSDTHLAVKQWGDIAIPTGVVERGNVHDRAKLTAVLKELRERTGAQYARVSLPEEHAYLFETTVAADTQPKDMRGLLEFRLEENVPISPRDSYFDYAIIGTDPRERQLRVAVAVYAQSTINSYYEACIAAGILPLSFEIEAQAIARAAVPRGEHGTAMIVDFGKMRMGVGIVHRGVLVYTSTIELAGEEMSRDMRSIVGDIAESEITKIKNTRGLMHTRENEQVANILGKYARHMVDELSIRIQYWHTRDIDRAAREIKKVIICGGSANLLGLPEYLEDALKIPTERAHVWGNAFSLEDTVPPITRRYSYGYATAIGLALHNFT
jgi:type IV pilus assembly protein PilM